MYKSYEQYLLQQHSTDKYRSLPNVKLDLSISYLDFSNNDYLGLSKNPEVIQSAIMAAKKFGVGATGSRLISGNNNLIESLEAKIAIDKQTQSALIFNSGFQTNFSVLSSLLDPGILGEQALVFFDKANHSSLYQAIFLSKAKLIRFQHNNMIHLSQLLNKFEKDHRPKFIISETLFGMEGDLLPLTELINLAEIHDAFLYLDEAHALGLFGSSGYGLSSNYDFKQVKYLLMGTFSKAIGCSGGYIACSQLIKNFLINKTPGFIYSTANSPMLIGAASKAWDLIRSLDIARENLKLLATNLRKQLKQLGFDTGLSNTHIIPIILKSEKLALQLQKKLEQQYIRVSCIRPPTIPPGTSRLRIALNSQHTQADIDALISGLINS